MVGGFVGPSNFWEIAVDYADVGLHELAMGGWVWVAISPMDAGWNRYHVDVI